MRRQLRAGIVAAAAMLAALGTTVRAQSIEAAPEPLVLGQPLSLRLLVRGFEIDPGRVGADCVQIHIWQGDSDLTAPHLDIHARPLAQDGQVLLHVSSAQPVVEPLLRARVQLRCGATFSKELALFAEPASAEVQAASTRPAGWIRPTAGPLQPTPRSNSPKLAAASPGAGAATQPASLAVAGTGSGRHAAQLRLEEATLEPLVSAVLNALLQRQPELLRPAPAAHVDAGLRPMEAEWLREVQRLQDEQRQARAQLASLQLRLERQESGMLQRWGAIAAVVAGLLAAALGLRLAREHILPRLVRNPLTRQNVEPLSAAAPTACEGPWLDDAAPAIHPSDLRCAPLFEPYGASDGVTNAPAPPPNPSVPSQPTANASNPEPSLNWPTMPANLTAGSGPGGRNSWLGADFGEPHLEGSGCTPALQQVDQMIANGFHGAAATILEHALQTRPGKSPWLLLRLLELYARMQQPQNRERVAAQLEALYNLRVPPAPQGESIGTDEGPPLEEWPELLDRLCAAWPQPSAALDWLRAHLLRERGLPPVGLAAFRDLLLLYDLARLREAGDAPDLTDIPRLAA